MASSTSASGGLSSWAKGAILGLLMVFGVWAWQSCSGEERKLRRQLEGLEELLAKDGEESALLVATKLRGIGEAFAQDFVIRASDYSGELQDRRELAGVVQGYRDQASTLTVSFSGLEAELDPSGILARGEVVARVRARVEGDPAAESYRLALEWRRVDGEWKLATVELLEVLEGDLFGRL